jgi:hypothetical protein
MSNARTGGREPVRLNWGLIVALTANTAAWTALLHLALT